MIREGTVHLPVEPMYSLGPGIALLITVFACNALGDALRDALDPRQLQPSLGADTLHQTR